MPESKVDAHTMSSSRPSPVRRQRVESGLDQPGHLGILETTLDEAGLSTSVGATDGFIDADTIIIDDPLKPKEPRFE